MKTHLDFGEAQIFKLREAILIYRAGNQHQIAASVHPITMNGQTPIIGPGQPVTRSGVEALATSLGRNLAACFLPPHVLSLSFGQIVWFCPAGRHRIWFKPVGNGSRKFPLKSVEQFL